MSKRLSRKPAQEPAVTPPAEVSPPAPEVTTATTHRSHKSRSHRADNDHHTESTETKREKKEATISERRKEDAAPTASAAADAVGEVAAVTSSTSAAGPPAAGAAARRQLRRAAGGAQPQGGGGADGNTTTRPASLSRQTDAKGDGLVGDGLGPVGAIDTDAALRDVQRSVFASVNFAAPAVANGITNKVLFRVLLTLRHPQMAAAIASAASEKRRNNSRGGEGGEGSASSSAGAAVLSTDAIEEQLGETQRRVISAAVATDDSLEDTHSAIAALVSNSSAEVTDALANKNFVAIAADLSRLMEASRHRVRALLRDEEHSYGMAAAACRTVESRERAMLSRVRLGLDGTSTRLRSIEDRLAAAATATSGIEHHLAQAKARVTRGKAVARLLTHHENFNKLRAADLSAICKSLSKARVEQRKLRTDDWIRNGVSHANPQFFSNEMFGAGGAVKRLRGGGRSADVVAVAAAAAADNSESESESDDSDTSDDSNSDDSESSNDNDEGDDNGNSNKHEKLHHSEISAIAAGLGKVFACRSSTVAAVRVIAQLRPLATELADIFPTAAANISTYCEWLQNELLNACFHLLQTYCVFYDADPLAAESSALGKALLRSVEAMTVLYTVLTGSHRGVVDAYLAKSLAAIDEALRRELTLTPLPPVPPLTEPSNLLACDLFASHLKMEIAQVFDFLSGRTRREVSAASAIGGDAAPAVRQQVITQLINSGVKPFVLRAIGDANALSENLVAQEGRLSPRSKRRSATRVTDGLAFTLTMYAELYGSAKQFAKSVADAVAMDRAEGAFIHQMIADIFAPTVQSYVGHTLELSLLRRQVATVELAYIRDLTPDAEGGYDVRAAHAGKQKEMLSYAEASLSRLKIVAPKKDIGPLVEGILMELTNVIGGFVAAELKKAVDICKRDASHWRDRRADAPAKTIELLFALIAKNAKGNSKSAPVELAKLLDTIPAAQGSPEVFFEHLVHEGAGKMRDEVHMCGLRLLSWSQSALIALLEVHSNHLGAVVAEYPAVVQTTAEYRASALGHIDATAETLLNIVQQAAIVRSLSILDHYQDRLDFRPPEEDPSKQQKKKKENTSGNSGPAYLSDTVGSLRMRTGTFAMALFARYLAFQLRELGAFLRISCLPLPSLLNDDTGGGGGGSSSSGRGGGSNNSAGGTNTSSPGAIGVGDFGTGANSGPYDFWAIVNSNSNNNKGKSTPAATKQQQPGAPSSSSQQQQQQQLSVLDLVHAMPLRQMIYPEIPTLARVTGVCLYKGLVAHILGFFVNDTGAMILKRDVSKIRDMVRASALLQAGIDGVITGVLFDLIREATSLLVVPLDNVRSVKESGLIQMLLTNEEKVRYLKMRLDLRDAFRRIES